MNALINFLRLIRIGNLLVMGLTMCVIQLFIQNHQNVFHVNPVSVNKIDLTALDFNFFLLFLTVFLIAGAGNIINDYFDVKADRVNKPYKMIVDKHIKRRWAIVLNWIFNAVGLLIAIYLSIKGNNYWIAVISFFTINFLWFYSALYKRRIFVGNFIVAVLVGIVPLYVLIYNIPSPEGTWFPTLMTDQMPLMTYEVVFIIAVIAFVINLMREIIKDIADIRGDMQLAAKTVPIVLGIRSSKIILILLLVPLLFLMAFFVFGLDRSISEIAFHGLFSLMILLSGISCIMAFSFLITSNTRKNYLRASNLLKVAMLFGILSPIFI